jgi:hypothetical protein
MAERDVQAGLDYDGESAAEAAHGARGKQIIDLIKAKLTKGELKASALQPPSLARVEIPAGLWGELCFEFAGSRAQAKTDGYKFVGVELSANLGTTDTRTAACQAWLQGEVRQLKKIMQARAQDRIAGLTTREFDAAYSAVFPAKRGRPRKENNKITRA